MDDVNDIIEYYNNSQEQEDTRLDRHQLEFELTWRYLDAYLPAHGRILEVGAATGRYTLALARHGCQVTAVDMSPVLQDKCRQNLEQAGLADRVKLVLADARDLSSVPGWDFDAVLLMGPLYHLVEEDDRLAALKQAYNRLRPGGLLFSAFISRYGIMGDVMASIPEWIEKQEEVRYFLKNGHRPKKAAPGDFRGYFARVPEIAPLHEAVGFETICLAAVEPAISADDESYNRLEGKQRQLWLDLLFELSTEPTTIGASRHLLYLGRKQVE